MMDLKTKDIVEAGGKVILTSGIEALSLNNLALELKIDYDLLFNFLKKDDDILKLLLESLGIEIKQLINDARVSGKSPENELQLLFERIYKLFNEKPYYLTIIYSTELEERDAWSQVILSGIKAYIKAYLLVIIKKGKRETLFKNNLESGSLTKKILGSFRSFMNEQCLINKMVKDLEILKVIND